MNKRAQQHQEVITLLRQILSKLTTSQQTERQIMSLSEDALAEVTALTTVADSMERLLDEIFEELQNAGGDPDAIQAIIEQAQVKKAQYAEAVARNTAAADEEPV